jgi:hypothetical protein
MDKILYFKVIDHIPSIFPVINSAYKIYLFRNDYPKSNYDKFMKFLQLINLVKPDYHDSDSKMSFSKNKLTYKEVY